MRNHYADKKPMRNHYAEQKSQCVIITRKVMPIPLKNSRDEDAVPKGQREAAHVSDAPECV